MLARGEDLVDSMQEGGARRCALAAWPGGESCCYSKNASLRSGLAVPLVTRAPIAAGI